MIEQALPEKLVAEGLPKEKKRRSKEDMGYNLSGRRPSDEHLIHKYAIDEDRVKRPRPLHPGSPPPVRKGGPASRCVTKAFFEPYVWLPYLSVSFLVLTPSDLPF